MQNLLHLSSCFDDSEQLDDVNSLGIASFDQ